MRKGMFYRGFWPDRVRLYVGQQGSLPKLGERVQVTNTFDNVTTTGTVTGLDSRQREYTVTLDGQLALEEV